MLEYETVMKSCLPGPCAMVEGPIVFIYSGCPGPGKNSWIPDGYFTWISKQHYSRLIMLTGIPIEP